MVLGVEKGHLEEIHEWLLHALNTNLNLHIIMFFETETVRNLHVLFRI